MSKILFRCLLSALLVFTAAAAMAQAVGPEPHLTNLHQLTDGGENAEAYWSFDSQSKSPNTTIKS